MIGSEMTALGIGIIAAGLGASWIFSNCTRAAEGRARREKFADRSSLDPIKIFRSTVRDDLLSEADFLEAWDSIARIFQLDPGKLRPDDKLKDLEVGMWGFTNDFFLLENYLTRDAICRDDLRKVGTLPDVISAVRFACMMSARNEMKARK